MQVNILNPKAVELLKNFADLNLISIQETGNDNFLKVINFGQKLKKITRL